jgi:hypothetical protein
MVRLSPLSRIYDSFDSFIMKGINTGVRAWNWTTGRTKADLANTLLTIAPMADTVYVSSIDFSKDHLSWTFLPIMLLYSHLSQKNK